MSGFFRIRENVPGSYRAWVGAGCLTLAWALALVASTLVLASGGYALADVGLAPSDERESSLPAQLQRIYYSGVPESLTDLRLMSQHQQQLIKQVSRVTVGIQIGATQGSGVIVSKDGYVLTAAHVAGRADLEVRVHMPDGQKYRGTTLGMNKGADAALLKIAPQTRDGQLSELPYAQMGSTPALAEGSWCMALGHPGGYQEDRQPVARFGRILSVGQSEIVTDCKLVGGDSGGPLFDMEGRVIGVHSRIGNSVTKNLHVPIDIYEDHWDRLARGDTWGSLLDVVGRPIIGVLGERNTDDARIAQVLPASPAERAGIQAGDVVTRFAGREVKTFEDLKQLVKQRHPGDEVTLEILRGDQKLEKKVILGVVANS